MRKRKPPRDDFLEAEFALALRGAGCPACRLARETERAVLSWLATTNIREDATITKLIDARGLCAAHWASVLERRRGDLGPSGARLLSRIAEAAANDVGVGVVEGSPPCPVCASVERRSRSVLGMVFAMLEEPEGLATYQLSTGLCRPHLAMAIELAPKQTTLRSLTATHRRSLVALGDRARAAAEDPEVRALSIRRIIGLLAGSMSDH